jgi:hypothetical protein
VHYVYSRYKRVRAIFECAIRNFLSDSHTNPFYPTTTSNTLAAFSYMATPNEEASLKTRIDQAKTFLQEHDTETITTAARIYKVPRSTLASSIKRPSVRHGGQNRILSSTQELAIHHFIRSYLDHGLLPTKNIILGVISYVRGLEGKPPPSKIWFQKWWKTQPLHKITTKPIERDRITAQDKGEVEEWFKQYRKVLRDNKISRKDIWNFDETGFRIGCPKGEVIYVPEEVKEVSYSNILGSY